MPIFTDKHCLMCYKEVCVAKPTTTVDPNNRNGPSSTSGSSEAASMNFASNSKALNKNSEVCRRFCTLASRHYGVEDPAFQSEKTLNSKWMVNMDRACDSCTEKLSSFCDIYYQRQYLDLQLECRGSEILEVMEVADDENSKEYAPHKKTLEEKMKTYDMSMDEIDDFRGELKFCITDRRKKLYPRVKLKREKTGEEEEEDEDDLFTPIPPKKKLKTADSPNEKENVEGVSKDQPQSVSVTKGDPLEQTTSPKTGGRRASGNSAHSNDSNYSSSDSDDDLFTRVVTMVKKKRAAKKIRPDRTNNNNNSNSNDEENKRMITARSDSGFQTRSSSHEDINQAEIPSNWHEEGW